MDRGDASHMLWAQQRDAIRRLANGHFGTTITHRMSWCSGSMNTRCCCLHLIADVTGSHHLAGLLSGAIGRSMRDPIVPIRCSCARRDLTPARLQRVRVGQHSPLPRTYTWGRPPAPRPIHVEGWRSRAASAPTARAGAPGELGHVRRAPTATPRTRKLSLGLPCDQAGASDTARSLLARSCADPRGGIG